jgi:hypothetical protein
MYKYKIFLASVAQQAGSETERGRQAYCLRLKYPYSRIVPSGRRILILSHNAAIGCL